MAAQKANGPSVVVHGARTRGVRRAALAHAARTTLAEAAPHVRGEVTIVLTRDSEVHRLNLEFRGLDRPTDVLAFDIGDGTAYGEPFGDVVISLEQAARQATEYDASLETELLRLVVHGTLHLCGYDHHERRAAARMFGLTRRLLKHLCSTPSCRGRASARPSPSRARRKRRRS